MCAQLSSQQAMKYRILDDELIEEIASLDPDDQGAWLYLSSHPEYKGAWLVDSLDPGFQFDFEDLIGNYRVLWPSDLNQFKQRCEELDYQIAFVDDPSEILDSYAKLQDKPPVRLASHLEGTVEGFLPWQIKGFNKIILPELRGGLCFWDTGTGKTAFVAAGILWHAVAREDAEFCFVVVKSNNKRDMQRKLKKLGNIESCILDGKPTTRAKRYADIAEGSTPQVLITNYEKFREDEDFLKLLVTGRRVLIFWDEMPTKLSNRGSQLYKSVRDVLYEPPENSFLYGSINWDRKRPSWLRQYELTATPIERDPGGQFSCVRLIDPEILGTAADFEKEHVLRRNPISKKPESWHRIEKMGYRLESIMHRVDKTDPEVAKYFPKLIEDDVYIDWNPRQRALYEALQAQAKLMVKEDQDVSVLALIMVLQMVCDAPSMVKASAAKREAWEALAEEAEMEGTDTSAMIKHGSEMAVRMTRGVRNKFDEKAHTKIDKLREVLLEKHPDSKVLLFSTWSDYIFPVLERQLNEWGVTYEVYRGTERQRLLAKDHWRSDPSVRVLLCSDAGSDSLDLPEANIVINYNLPWLYSRKYQRIHRASRADSSHETLYVYNFLMANSVEERRQELIDERHGYHNSLVDIGTKSNQSANLTSTDLMYILGANT
jgi:SNF2 family DNA or RNA helicase